MSQWRQRQPSSDSPASTGPCGGRARADKETWLRLATELPGQAARAAATRGETRVAVAALDSGRALLLDDALSRR